MVFLQGLLALQLNSKDSKSARGILALISMLIALAASGYGFAHVKQIADEQSIQRETWSEVDPFIEGLTKKYGRK